VGGGDEVSLAVAGFLTARCAGRDKYFLVTDAIYHAQAEINRTGQPHEILLNIARSVGLTDAKFEACIKDEKAIADLQKRVEGYAKNDKINSTPTFIVNGKRFEAGEMTLPQMDAAVAEAAAHGKPAN
jgi:protein-disulfide isomerase